ncbi:FMN-binding negative transcriptional regulator [Alkalicoccus saliphilus]|uniref:Protease n=1 Tax=Alkalicoccus saliphilus TaxID=200989 RepID=A0A2T4U3V3_9BACI|nr:FMN-binding negative transcriptional regulator [Alkalicoccus saliphilus]PTL38072.1 protease [Alkalicoccus saliphilus]
MYIPKYFKVENTDEILDFVEQHSFGTVVTTDQGKPIATHLPLQLVKEEESYFVTGHAAYGNPQWKTLEANEEVLVMFQGPHAYISSSWYEKENVPTWNYQAVHIYGTATLLNEEELKKDLAKLLEKFEKQRENPVLWENLSTELLENQLKGIVGFKIKVHDIQAAYKLSQNRHTEDYENIIHQLYKEKNPSSSQVARSMEKNFRENK